MEYEHITHSFEPIYNEYSEILILGTLPSVKSRENNFYYGHKQNRFWKLLAKLCEEETPQTVEEKTAMLLRHHIAIWDVIQSCDIKGSSDSSIRNVVPNDIRPILEKPSKLPDYMEPIGIGVPADLLLRRPDIRQAERQVNAQAATLGASQSDWLPQVFLKGSIGYSSHDLKDLTKRNSMTFEIAPSISWTLFSGTKLVNATRLARAQLDESIHQFNQTVLTAVQETDNAMNSYRNSIQQIVAMREVCNQGEETLKLSLDLYKQGLTPFQNVLDALRSLLTYENQLVQAQGSSLLHLIALYQVLGGGYEMNQK